MRALLLAAAPLAAIAFTTPATAKDEGSSHFNFRSDTLTPVPDFRFGPRDGDRRDRRRHHGSDGAILYYDREYQGDTTWRSNSFNDWWHDQPHRAYPAWMQRNQNCERMWWSGGGWRC